MKLAIFSAMKMFSKILAGQLYDPHLRQLVPNQLITVCRSTGLITHVETFTATTTTVFDDETIDLRHLTLCPGFVDAHVHFFLHSYAETSWIDQLTKESLAERTIRATVHANRTLMAGYTSVRDLGTEGAEDADIGLRKSLSGPNPLIAGPRYFTANRAIVSTGSYGPKGAVRVNKEGLDDVVGAEAADGPMECIRVVRRQIGAGADCIKIYADYPVRSRLLDVSPRIAGKSIRTFNYDELKILINTVHQYNLKIAAHAKTVPVMQDLLELGIDSIEHGSELHTSVEIINKLASPLCRTVWVPTLAAYYSIAQRTGDSSVWDTVKKSFQAVLAAGLGNVAIACGGDTGVFNHGENALEMDLMVQLGAPWEWVLRWATLGGWECIGGVLESEPDGGDNAVPFGWVKEGWAADLVGLEGNLATDFSATIRRVQFVMKRGRVYKLRGKQVPLS
ncbi:Amidohydro-rel domain-containing protein [Mycena indigotica]|uniref:Amidohydro-rel domain-containing protein n=1 Tax=Mycena indigotica TaxID=2126181 RepID=A0A8H6W5T2_9AGAR|nr:Amidohydro-rel domain-containing protein [Mycena indigotica]KAF7303856.1 Amidohydro-rel domain-containing protein [Mycena indigotica]